MVSPYHHSGGKNEMFKLTEGDLLAPTVQLFKRGKKNSKNVLVTFLVVTVKKLLLFKRRQHVALKTLAAVCAKDILSLRLACDSEFVNELRNIFFFF